MRFPRLVDILTRLGDPRRERMHLWVRRESKRIESHPEVRAWVDRWDTGLVDITGNQGLLAQESTAAPPRRSPNGSPSATRTGAHRRPGLAHTDHACGHRHVRGVRPCGATGTAQGGRDRRPVPSGQEGQRHARRGAPPCHPGPTWPSRPQGRCRVAQPPPTATRR